MEFIRPSITSKPQALTVKQLVRQLSDAVKIAFPADCWVVGELSNIKRQLASGHVYFTLKEQGAEISCVMFSTAAKCAVKLEDGVKVHVWAAPTIYTPRGQLQLNVKSIKAVGQGDLQARYLELKDKLQAEGLFDSARKRAIPSFPASIGIVTSATGAVIQDIRRVLERRAPWVKAYLWPVRVQGVGAESEIAHAIDTWSRENGRGLPGVDVLIVGRGGGSIEDLWCFNEEIVARAIAGCVIPVISAVGHETDYTIADFVADLRAATPTAAAELATPDGPALLQKLGTTQRRLILNAKNALTRAQLILSDYSKTNVLDVQTILAPHEQRLDLLEERLTDNLQERFVVYSQQLEFLTSRLTGLPLREQNALRFRQLEAMQERLFYLAEQRVAAHVHKLDLLSSQLNACDPVGIMQRGYSLVTNAAGHAVKTKEQVKEGNLLTVHVSDGGFDVTVTRTAE